MRLHALVCWMCIKKYLKISFDFHPDFCLETEMFYYQIPLPTGYIILQFFRKLINLNNKHKALTLILSDTDACML